MSKHFIHMKINCYRLLTGTGAFLVLKWLNPYLFLFPVLPEDEIFRTAVWFYD